MEVKTNINWFPGHMQKAKREMKEKTSLVNIVYMVLDSRIPKSSFNHLVKEIASNRPILLLLNKADLADKIETKKWMDYYKSQGYYCLDIDAITGYNMNKIVPLTYEILKDKIERNKERGIKLSMKAMITGIPNVGKSTIINALVKKKITQVGDKPGVTKTQQWVKLDSNLDLLDTPGVLWPKLEENGMNLALTGAIKDDIMPIDEIVKYGFDFMNTYYKEAFYERYKIDKIDSIYDIYEKIAKARGCKIDDYEKINNIFLHDLRHEKLGRVTVDRLTSV
ncbi:MAG: ribosome biogenesis GTPase YlqF [Acholeplasmatales bacterium]|nr:ribosome biogenesis GTPase YlqF [Acholeplasmatales bacterium]